MVGPPVTDTQTRPDGARDEAGDGGYCFPSQRRLAAKCSTTDRTVRRVLLELTTKGYVSLQMRRRVDGSRTSNGYRLACGEPTDKMSGGTDMSVRGPRTTVSEGADSVLRGVLISLYSSKVQPVLDELAGRMKIARITNPIRYCAALIERIKRSAEAAA